MSANPRRSRTPPGRPGPRRPGARAQARRGHGGGTRRVERGGHRCAGGGTGVRRRPLAVAPCLAACRDAGPHGARSWPSSPAPRSTAPAISRPCAPPTASSATLRRQLLRTRPGLGTGLAGRRAPGRALADRHQRAALAPHLLRALPAPGGGGRRHPGDPAGLGGHAGLAVLRGGHRPGAGGARDDDRVRPGSDPAIRAAMAPAELARRSGPAARRRDSPPCAPSAAPRRGAARWRRRPKASGPRPCARSVSPSCPRSPWT